METTVQQTRKPVITAISNDAMILAAILAKLEPSQEVTYAELSRAIGRDVQHAAAGILHTAKKRALRDHNVVVETIHGVGLRRVVGKELLDAQRPGIERIRGEARRRSEKISKVDMAALDNSQKVAAASLLSVYGVLGHLATSSGLKKIAGACEKLQGAQLAIGQTLALFHNGSETNAKNTTSLDAPGHGGT